MSANLAINKHPRVFGVPALPRDDFNGLAAQRGLPLRIENRLIDPAGLTPADVVVTDPIRGFDYISNGKFTPRFIKQYKALVEMKRRDSVGRALGEGRGVKISHSVGSYPAAERKMIKCIKEVARLIDLLYMKQEGSFQYIDEIERLRFTDPDAYKLFWRENGPWATGTKGEQDPFANALESLPVKKEGVFPEDVELTPEVLEKIQKDTEGLGNQWTVVVKDAAGELKAVPYHVYWKNEMCEIATELEKAAQAVAGIQEHATLVTYLRAQARAFRDGSWFDADRAWVAMSQQNSKYAIRVAPDETYWGTGNMKAGFQLWFSEIDRETARKAQDILVPRLQQMENEIAKLVPLYKARTVAGFPIDFIHMLLRAGDHKSAYGATIGEKLPNFYRSDKDNSYSRMVVMTNYYTDPASRGEALAKRQLLLSARVLAGYSAGDELTHIDTLMHEMTHSLGVSAESYVAKNPDGTDRVDEAGKSLTSAVAMGGTNAQVIEELKAQTGALYWIGWQQQQGLISKQEANDLYTNAILWAFGHISKGLGTLEKPRTYSQLAAIQIRKLMDAGAITYNADEGEGETKGRFDFHFDKFHAAVTTLFQDVNRIQVLGDREAATKLRADVIDGGEGYTLVRAKEVKERFSGFPTASFELEVSR